MKVDSPNIDKRTLRRLPENEYELRAATLSFVPGGKESRGYLVETLDQSRYFCKVYEEIEPHE
jgi:hypothetical protein